MTSPIHIRCDRMLCSTSPRLLFNILGERLPWDSPVGEPLVVRVIVPLHHRPARLQHRVQVRHHGPVSPKAGSVTQLRPATASGGHHDLPEERVGCPHPCSLAQAHCSGRAASLTSSSQPDDAITNHVEQNASEKAVRLSISARDGVGMEKGESSGLTVTEIGRPSADPQALSGVVQSHIRL